MTVNRPTPCVGYDDARGVHHDCERPDLSTSPKGSSGGRCASCAQNQRTEARFLDRVKQFAPDRSVALHPRHIIPTTYYAVTCANCGTRLLTATAEELQGYRDGQFDCGRCGASWRVTDKTLAEVAA